MSTTDQMRAGLLVYTTEGLYIDILFTQSGGGAPGYRKNFDFGGGERGDSVYVLPGEYFGHGQ